MAKRETKVRQLSIKWEIPDDLISRYANNVVIQHGANEFIISFFEIVPPIILGDEEDLAKFEKSLDSVVAKCVGRFILPPGQLEPLINTLQRNLDIYKSRFGEPEETE